MVNNIANKMRSAQSPNNISTAAKIEREPYVKPTFVPIKEKIKHMEQQSHTEKCELEQRFKEISAVHKERDEEGNGTPLTVENNGNGNHHPHHHPQQQQRETSCSSFDSETDGGRVAGETTPPKPLPRTSRNNSVSEQLAGTAGSVGSGEDVSPPGPVAAPAGATNVPRPVARPRTTSGYKVNNLRAFVESFTRVFVA